VLIVSGDSPIRALEDLSGKRIATELVGFTRRYLADRGIKATVEFSWGATEAKVSRAWPTRRWKSPKPQHHPRPRPAHRLRPAAHHHPADR